MITIWGIFIVWISLFLLFKMDEPQFKTLTIVLPHFTIVPKKLDTVRSQMAYEIWTKEPTIIIISPDHFDTYRTNDLLYDDTIANVCIQWYCQEAQWAWIAPLSSSYTITNHTLILPDHGVGAHLRFIKKRLPNAKIIPLLLQPRSIDRMSALKKKIEMIASQQPTIIIGSVDWSHYVPEPWAKLHDYTSWSTIASHDIDWTNRKSLDVDCPSCLWLIDHIAQDNHTVPSLLWRDSSATLFWSTGVDNTSRWVVWYAWATDKKTSQEWWIDTQISLATWITLLMWGDVIYDRWVQEKLPTMDDLKEHFLDRYELHDTNKSLFFSFHRLWAWIDITMVNLETPLYSSWTTCYPLQKAYSFCSHEMILDILSSIGFNTISFANNHSYDAGKEQYIKTKDIIKHHNMEVFGNDEMIKKVIRWVPIALLAYDFIVTNKQKVIDKACSDIRQSVKEWYKPLLSVHRWDEYAKDPVYWQKDIAKKLIECGAKAIIWHHPHVVQSIEWIDHVPVIYSLWNFLMDQSFSQDTSYGMMVGLFIPFSGDIRVFTGSIRSFP